MKIKPVTPYERLMRRYMRAISRAQFPMRRTMFTYPASAVKDGTGYALMDLAERTRAADQLGYDVRLRWADAGLQVEYVKRFEEPTE